ncbi:hypothetical protein EV122DRAFT_261023, partial [Schizophyllum commune]
RLPRRTGPTPRRRAPRRARGKAPRAARSTNTSTSRRPRAPPRKSPRRARKAPRTPTPTCQTYPTRPQRAGATSNDVFGRPSPRSGAGVWYPSCSGPSRRGSPRSSAATTTHAYAPCPADSSPTWPALAQRPLTETYAEYMYICMVYCYLMYVASKPLGHARLYMSGELHFDSPHFTRH